MSQQQTKRIDAVMSTDSANNQRQNSAHAASATAQLQHASIHLWPLRTSLGQVPTRELTQQLEEVMLIREFEEGERRQRELEEKKQADEQDARDVKDVRRYEQLVGSGAEEALSMNLRFKK